MYPVGAVLLEERRKEIGDILSDWERKDRMAQRAMLQKTF